MTAWFGADRVAFLKIDGQSVTSLSRKYGISSYPSFIYLKAGSNGEVGSVFSTNPRNYDTFKAWMLQSVGNEPLKAGVHIAGFREEIQIKNMK